LARSIAAFPVFPFSLFVFPLVPLSLVLSVLARGGTENKTATTTTRKEEELTVDDSNERTTIIACCISGRGFIGIGVFLAGWSHALQHFIATHNTQHAHSAGRFGDTRVFFFFFDGFRHHFL
jgi:hypothetical protein